MVQTKEVRALRSTPSSEPPGTPSAFGAPGTAYQSSDEAARTLLPGLRPTGLTQSGGDAVSSQHSVPCSDAVRSQGCRTNSSEVTGADLCVELDDPALSRTEQDRRRDPVRRSETVIGDNSITPPAASYGRSPSVVLDRSLAVTERGSGTARNGGVYSLATSSLKCVPVLRCSLTEPLLLYRTLRDCPHSANPGSRR